MAEKECFVTMITPYHKDKTIDFETVRKYVEFYYDAGLDGIFSVCQSSEIFNLSPEERAELNRVVYEKAKSLSPDLKVISSGHVSDALDDQIRELNEICESGTDALILITNRLAAADEDDGVLLSRLRSLMENLPKDIPLGLYECPYPYKRLLTRRVLDFCASTDRFTYIKDTCCQAPLIAERVQWLRGSTMKLCNANCQTLLETLRAGADGYCGIMANFHPALYAHICHDYDLPVADKLQALIGNYGFTETLCYPLIAKYHMGLCGIPTENIARHRDSALLTPYEMSCMQQMKAATDLIEERLKRGTL